MGCAGCRHSGVENMQQPLIFHIGLPRTGTTTLQTLVFPQLTRIAYFNKDATPASAQLIRAFRRSPEIWRLRGDDIFNKLRAQMREKMMPEAVLISGEGMSAHRIFAAPGANRHRDPFERRDPFFLAAHLRECEGVAKRAGFDSVKVIIGIRRQDQYLASLYATGGWMAVRPGQYDFERQTREIIDPDKRYFTDGIWLDYKATRDLIAEAVGEGNVLLLPLEQLGDAPSRYLAALSEFVGEPLDSLALKRQNPRNIAPDIWQIRKKAMERAARKMPFGRFRALLARAAEIRLSSELKEKILAAYRDSNRGLASNSKLELAQYGYCGNGTGL